MYGEVAAYRCVMSLRFCAHLLPFTATSRARDCHCLNANNENRHISTEDLSVCPYTPTHSLSCRAHGRHTSKKSYSSRLEKASMVSRLPSCSHHLSLVADLLRSVHGPCIQVRLSYPRLQLLGSPGLWCIRGSSVDGHNQGLLHY